MAKDEPSHRLNSWKEIAAYLGCDVRTAQRREQRSGLPVYRPNSSEKGAVYAFREELDVWIRHRAAESAANMPGAVKRNRLGWLAVCGIIVVVLIIASLGIYLMRHPAIVERAAVSGRTLSTWDGQGRLAWTYEFPKPFRDLPQKDLKWRVQVVDLDGDGLQEVLVAASFPGDSRDDFWREELYCFSAKGKITWRYKPETVLTFRGRSFNGPWIFNDILIGVGSVKKIWATIASVPWWPSMLLEFDATGNSKVRFVNSGVIYALHQLRTKQGTFILAGGVNNEYATGALAVLQENQPPASSPQSPGCLYACDNCPGGQPFRYFIFPRSEINLLLDAYNDVIGISTHGNKLVISTLEVRHAPQGPIGNYELSEDFDEPRVSVSFSDGYWELHRRLAEEGRLKHTTENCPERMQGKKVRMWSPDSGWNDISVVVSQAHPDQISLPAAKVVRVFRIRP